MKRPLEEAAELFKECEKRAGEDRDKAALYRGLRLLADGLRRMEKELAEVESEMHDGPSRFYQRRHPKRVFAPGRCLLERWTKMIKGFEPPRFAEPEGQSRLQWGPALGAGLIAGLVLLILPRGSPWEAMTSYTPGILGRMIPSSWATLSFVVIIIHLTLSLVYGVIIALTITNVRSMKAVLTGGVVGLALYLLNFGVVTLWLPDLRGGEVSVIVTHVVFGLIAAGAYRGLLRRTVTA